MIKCFTMKVRLLMSKMSKVAKMFGKKIGEEFEILDTKKNIILQ